jgi:hypothetical protein
MAPLATPTGISGRGIPSTSDRLVIGMEVDSLD